ncbi:myosin-like coiled-coil protein-domain-containing protein [Lasiosphaeria miniovina]|uniref:Myosin-like coiled-coil protein-domain-containing protein n=1 Tax=Lasiosphaeria miniovina TaxID=1954250 RepID=A0AA40E8L2_9PEZI|nr:myosin-like coiled-coil protein-domain-containing protein [Lasiosphaeria miniovina]KAK0728016.1 myosin-like coiled-coil protein-domain-containing protein [Lasiosphaeria miniovina]
MSTANPLVTSATAAPRPATPIANGVATHAVPDLAATNSNGLQPHESRPAPAPPAPAAGKKGKQKKATEPNEASKLIAARISQLELDAAGEKDQEAEIEREVKKANRELHSQTSRMSDIQKIDHLTKRCSDLLSEMKRHERESIKNKKRGDQLQKDKDNSRNELNKTTSLKEKLEKLCRELQKENNKLKNENKTLSDTQVRSQNSWDERYSGIMRHMDDFQEEKDNPRKQVVDMEMDEFFRQRFKSLIEQYEIRELHFHSQMRTKELEVQFNLAKFEREKKNYDAEVARSRQLNAQVQTFSKTENELRQQLNVYVDKFKQVEDTLNNSNDLFLTFRKEMEDMSKKTKRLERENENLKRKHEQVNGNILKMAEERNKNLHEIEDLKKKLDKLNGIIKQMQQQGRGIQQGMATPVENGYAGAEGGLEGDESEYEDEYDEGEDEEVSDEGDEYDDETEDELHQQQPQPQAYGPERPPPATAVTATATPTPTVNGHH